MNLNTANPWEIREEILRINELLRDDLLDEKEERDLLKKRDRLTAILARNPEHDENIKFSNK